MSYNEFISRTTTKTVNMLKYAISLYKAFEDKGLVISISEKERKEYSLNIIDRVYLMLYISSLMLTSTSNSKPNMATLLHHLNISLDKVKLLEEEEYLVYYDSLFKDALTTISEVIFENTRRRDFREVNPDNYIKYLYRLDKPYIRVFEILNGLEVINKRQNIVLEGSNTSRDDTTSLKEYGLFLTNMYYDHNPLVGSHDKLKELMISLMSNDKNVLLLGDYGCGKKTLVKSLAYLITNNMVPDILQDMKIVKLDMSLVMGSVYSSVIENRVRSIFNDLKDRRDIILFIEDINMFSSQKNYNVLEYFMPYLLDKRYKVIMSTTGYERNNKEFYYNFDVINIKEPSLEEVYYILLNTYKYLEKEYFIKISSGEVRDILWYIVSMTDRSLRNLDNNIVNPSLAIGLLKKSFAVCKYCGDRVVEKKHVDSCIKESLSIKKSVRTSIYKRRIYSKSDNIINFPNNLEK